jgi:nicotinamidase-related amidase
MKTTQPRTALILIDFINRLNIPQGRALLPHAIAAARRAAMLKLRARARGVPVIYANDNFGKWRSQFSDLAVELIVQADSQAERKIEFKRVQAAKLVHRMASGSHKRWERQRPGGHTVVEELHKYPHSWGKVLCHIGQQLERAAELLPSPVIATR